MEWGKLRVERQWGGFNGAGGDKANKKKQNQTPHPGNPQGMRHPNVGDAKEAAGNCASWGWILGSVRGGSGGCAVDRRVGGQGRADEGAARGTNRDANKGANSARGAPQETGLRAGGSADAGASGCADQKADQSVLATLGSGGSRDAHDVFALQRDVGTVFFECEQFIGEGDKFSAVVFQAGFDHFYPLANLQAIEVRPRTLLRLSG
jgi:hypothetical protein